MNQQTLIGVVAGAIAVTGVAAFAGYRVANAQDYADVVSAQEITTTVRTPRQVCGDVNVTHQKPVKDDKQITGTVIGAVVGGVLGSNIGSGSGRDVATVAGAAAGGYAGNKAQESIQRNNTYQTTEQRCRTVYDTHEQPTGEYRVRYRLDGIEREVRMDHDPGVRVAVRDGEIVNRRS